MAANDTKETQAQLDLQVQINNVLQSRIGILKAQEKALSGQVQMAVDLCKALKCEQLDEIESRLKTAREEMQRAAEDATHLGDELDDALGEGVEGTEGMTSALKKMVKDGLDPTHVTIAGLAAGIVRGFGSAMQTVTNLGSAFTGVLGTLGRLGKAIIGLPFQLLSGLFEVAQSGGGGGPSPIRQELERIRGEFGSLETATGKLAAGALEQFRSQMKNLAGTGLSVRKVFGPGREGFAKALAENAELMKALGPAVDNFTEALSKNAVELSMYRKGLGMTVEQQAKFMKFAQAAGEDPMKAMNKFASQAINMGESFGISSKLIAKDMAEMQSDFANFGGLGPKVMSQISVYTRKLGIEIKSLTGLISGFDDFEAAAQGAAKLSQAFGMNVDAMKMMQEQDPAARLSMLQKAFKETGRSIDSMSRQEKKLLAQQAGLDEEAAALAFSQQGLSMSYDQVQKAGAKAEKKQLTQAEAMAKLADSIERVFGGGGGSQFKGFFDAFSKGFERGVMKSKDFMGAMRAIRQSLRAVYWSGVEIGRMFVKMFPGLKEMLRGIKDLFNPARFKKMMADVKNIFGDLFKDLRTDPKAGVEKFLQRFKDLFKKFFSASGPGASTLMEGGKTFLKTLGAIFKALLPIVVNGAVTAIKALTKILRNPPDVSGAMTQLFKDLGTAMVDLLSALWERLSPALTELFTVVFEKARPWLMKAGGAVLGLTLGKVILNAVAGGTVGSLAAKAGKKISEFFKTAFENGAEGAAPESGGMTESIGKTFSEGVLSAVDAVSKRGEQIKLIAKIETSDILSAAGRLFLIAVTFIPSLVLFAAGIRLITGMFDMRTAAIAVLAMTAVGITALAIASLIPIIQTIQIGMLGQAIIGAAAAAIFVITGVLVLAGALRLISGAFSGLNWTEVAVGMAGLAVSVLAIGVMVLAAALLGMDGGTTAVIAVVGLLAATMFIIALSAFMLPLMLVANLLNTVNMDPMPWISMAAIMVSIAAMAIASALMIAAGPLGIAGMGFAYLFLLVFNESMLPMIQTFGAAVARIDFGEVAAALVEMSIAMAALAVLATASTVAGVASILGLLGLSYVGLFTLFLTEGGFIETMYDLSESVKRFSVDKLPDIFDSLSSAMVSIALLAGKTAIAGVASVLGLVGLYGVRLFVQGITASGLIEDLSQLVGQMPNFSNAADNIDALGGVISLISDLVALSESLTVYSLPYVGGLLEGGFQTIKRFGRSIVDDIGSFAEDISALDIDPSSFAEKSDALSGVFGIVAAMSEAASSLANVDTGFFGPGVTDVLSAAKDFISQVGTTIQGIVNAVVGVSMSPDQIASAAAMGDMFKAVGDLVKGLQPDPSVLQAMKSDNILRDDMIARMDKIPDLMSRTIDVVTDKIVPLVKKVVEAANLLGDPEAMGPKVKILVDAFSVISSFTKTIGSVLKDVVGDEIDDPEKAITKFSTIAGGIVEALFTGDTSYIIKAFNGIKALTDDIGDASALEPKIKLVASMFEIITKFGSAIGDVAKMMPERGGIGEAIGGVSPDQFTKNLENLTGENGLISKISTAVSGKIRSVYDGMKSMIEEIPDVSGGKLKEFERKGKVLGGLFDVMSKFASAVKDVASVGAVKDGAIDTGVLNDLINTVAGFFLTGSGTGKVGLIAEGIARMTAADSIKTLASNPGRAKALSSVFKAMGDFASGITSLKSLAGEEGNMTGIQTTLNSISTAFPAIKESTIDIAKKMSELQSGLEEHPLNTRTITRMTDFANGLSDVITALERISGPAGTEGSIATRITNLADSLATLNTALESIDSGDTDLALDVGRALSANGRVTIEHENMNIHLHVNIEMSAEQIGRGIIRWCQGDGARDTPRFVLDSGGTG